jgi:hypothetical protein
MSVTTALLTAIDTAIQADATLVAATDAMNYGVTPSTPITGDALTWFLVVDADDDFMQANSDYYKSVDIQFSAWTRNASPLTAQVIRDRVEAIFRFNILTLSTGRHLSTSIGTGLQLEDPEPPGWQASTTLTFEIGT